MFGTYLRLCYYYGASYCETTVTDKPIRYATHGDTMGLPAIPLQVEWEIPHSSGPRFFCLIEDISV